MAKFTFNLPDIGEGIAEAEIVAWHVSVGDMVEEDQQIRSIQPFDPLLFKDSHLTSDNITCIGVERLFSSGEFDVAVDTGMANFLDDSRYFHPIIFRGGDFQFGGQMADISSVLVKNPDQFLVLLRL